MTETGPGHRPLTPLESPSKKTWIILGLIVVACITPMAWSWWRSSVEAALPPLITRKEFDLARMEFERQNGRRAQRADILYLLAEALLSAKQAEGAIHCLTEIPTSHPAYGRMARYMEGVALVSLFRAVEAEKQLREVIALEEASPTMKSAYLIHARQRLRHILEVEIRLEERQEMLRGVINRGEDVSFEPVAGCFPNLIRWDGPDAVQWIEHFQASNPENAELNIALGRYRTQQGKIKEARQILEKVVQENPANLSALAALMACLREDDDPDELARIFKMTPPRSPQDPWQMLLQRGTQEIEEGHHQEAIACYEQMLKQDRTCAEAWKGLGQAKRLAGDDAESKKALQRAADLARIQSQLGKTVQDSANPDSFLDVADICAELNLNREGAVMTRCARILDPKSERAAAAVNLFRQRLADDGEFPLLGE